MKVSNLGSRMYPCKSYKKEYENRQHQHLNLQFSTWRLFCVQKIFAFSANYSVPNKKLLPSVKNYSPNYQELKYIELVTAIV